MAIIVLLFTSILALVAAIGAVSVGTGPLVAFGLYLLIGLVLPLALIAWHSRNTRRERSGRMYLQGII